MLRHVSPSVRLSTWNNSAFIGQIFFKIYLYIWDFTKICITEVRLKYDESKVHAFMLMFLVLRDK